MCIRDRSSMGRLGAAAPHLVPVVACQLELRAGGHLDLGERDQVIEAGLSRELLAQEPADLVERGPLRDPVEERIELARAFMSQHLEPSQEIRYTARYV